MKVTLEVSDMIKWYEAERRADNIRGKIIEKEKYIKQTEGELSRLKRDLDACEKATKAIMSEAEIV